MERPKRRKACAPPKAKRQHRAKNPLPPVGTEERIIMLRERHRLRQETLRRKRDKVEDLAAGPATYPIVECNGWAIGRVQVDERTVLAQVDTEEKAKKTAKLGHVVHTVGHACPSLPTNLEKLSISSRILLLRQNAGLSVWTAAKLIGMSRRNWHKLEAGSSSPGAGTAIRMATLFNVNVMLLIDGPAAAANN